MSTVTPPETYRRRNRLPVIAVLLLLLIATAVVWFTVMEPEASVSKGCNAPSAYVSTPESTDSDATGSNATGSDSATASGSGTADPDPAVDESAALSDTGAADASQDIDATTTADGTTADGTTTAVTTTLGTLVEHATLVSTRPANPATINVTVLNAGPTRGMARSVTDAWRTAGFDSIGAALNDPLYLNFDLRCYGEIRYGQAGLNAARTVLIVAPCAQLVMDGRIDDSVDFAVGAKYELEPVADQVITQLAGIRDAAAAPAVIEGQTAAPKPAPTIPPLPSAACPS